MSPNLNGPMHATGSPSVLWGNENEQVVKGR